MEFIQSGGTVIEGTVSSGGILSVAAGGSVLYGQTIAGGSAMISGSVHQSVGFAGSGGVLGLANLPGFAAVISGFAHGDAIDLAGFGFNAAEMRSFTPTGPASGSLVVTDGTQSASLSLSGPHVTSDFTLSNDGTGGTFIHHV